MARHQSSHRKESSQTSAKANSDALRSRPFAPTPKSQAPVSPAQESPPAEFSILEPSGSRPRSVQAKLTIGAPGDKYEQEADRVAAQVVQQINRPQTKQPQAVQRMDVPEEEELQMKPLAEQIQRVELPEEDELQMKPGGLQREIDPEEEDELQMKPMLQMKSGGAVTASDDLESAIQQSRGSGQPLADSIQEPIEQAFGIVDFSGVKVHTDGQSDQLNRSIQAKAFTTGQDIYFRQGAYQPGSQSEQKLIVHELTHVVQQNSTVQKKSINTTNSPQNRIQRMVYHDDLEKYYSQVLLGQEINENNAVITATSNASKHGGHTSIYTERLANNQPDNKKIHLTTSGDKSITVDILNNMTAIMGDAVREANKRSWVVNQSKVDDLITKAQKIKDNRDYKYKKIIVGGKKSIFKKKKRLNCALFGESILKAAGIKASSGAFNKPSALTKGKSKGYTQNQEFVDYEEQQRQEAERQERQEAENVFYANIQDGRYYINQTFEEGHTVRGTIEDPNGDLDQELVFSADTTEEDKLPLNLKICFVDKFGSDRVRVFHKDKNYYIRIRDMIEYKPK